MTSDDAGVPRPLKVGAAWSWRILLVLGLVALVIFLFVVFREIFIPFLVAILLASLLWPFSNWLQGHRWPKWAAIAVSFLGAILLVAAIVTLIVWQVRGGFDAIRVRTLQAADDFSTWFAGPPFNTDLGDLPKRVAEWWETFQQEAGFWDKVASVGSTVEHIGVGLVLALFATLFLLIDGPGIWHWFTRLFPQRSRAAIDAAAERGWHTLTAFTRVQIFVAAVDAVGIGVGAWILGLFTGGFPLVIPIALAVFLGSFIPIIGALVTGAFACIVALVYLGFWPAIIMLAIVLVVHETEAHVLQPLVMGSAIKIHPLAVVFAVAAGTLIAGIAGAVFAVPLVAVTNVVIRTLVSGSWRKPATVEDGVVPTPRDAE